MKRGKSIEFNEETLIDQDSVDIKESKNKVYLPNEEVEDDDYELVYDRKAYNFFYTMDPDWPALSLDCISSEKQECMPYECIFISGSQAPKAKDNKLYIINMRDIKSYNENSDNSTDDENSEDDNNSLEQVKDKPPVFNYSTIPYESVINKVRTLVNNNMTLAAVFSEDSKVSIYKLNDAINKLKSKTTSQHFKQEIIPISIIKDHLCEGFAISWNENNSEISTGDLQGKIYIGPIDMERTLYTDPQGGTIEDLVWNKEGTYLYSGGSSGIINIWDPRSKSKPVKSINLSTNVDINCIDLNKTLDNLLAVGFDDGHLKVIDVRSTMSEPLSDIRWHQCPISVLQWAIHEPLTLMVAEDGRQISFWDFSMKKCESEDINVPEQLLFIHQGQKYTKDARWHPDIPGMVISTGEDGYNIIKPINT